MNGTTVPLPGAYDVQLPSLRSLDLHLDVDGRPHNGAFQEPSVMIHDINPYPAYPLHGSNRLTDPSQNAFAESGFRSNGVSHIPQISLGRTSARDLSSDPEVWSLRRTASVRFSPYNPLFLRGTPGLVERTSLHPQDQSPTGLHNRETNPLTPATSSAPAPKGAGQQATKVSFADVAAHTAKCDECNRRNKDGMLRCLSCGWQCCIKCLDERGGDRSHVYLAGVHAPETEQGGLPVQPNANVSANPHVSARRRQSSFAPTPRGAQNESREGRAQRRLQSGQQRSTVHTQQRIHQNQSYDSEETLSCSSQGSSEDVIESVGFADIRRNPLRAARPGSSMATDDSE